MSSVMCSSWPRVERMHSCGNGIGLGCERVTTFESKCYYVKSWICITVLLSTYCGRGSHRTLRGSYYTASVAAAAVLLLRSSSPVAAVQQQLRRCSAAAAAQQQQTTDGSGVEMMLPPSSQFPVGFKYCKCVLGGISETWLGAKRYLSTIGWLSVRSSGNKGLERVLTHSTRQD